MALPTTCRRRPREQGVILVLALLVFLVLLVVVHQVFMSSKVELEHAANAVAARQARWLADACRIHAGSMLLMDLEEASEGEGGEGGEGEEGAPADGGLGGLGGDGGAGGGSDAAADVVGTTDSLLDEWKNPWAVAPPLGEGLTLHVEVVDEDGKINLLGLWAEDPEIREGWREVIKRLLDKAFEGTSRDISGFTTDDVLDNLDDWVKGERRDVFEDRAPPRLKRTDAEDEAASEVDTDIIEDDEVHFPMTLGELLLIEGLEPEHLDGFIEEDVFYPGLREYLTVWTHLQLKAPPPVEDEFAESPLAPSDPEAAAPEEPPFGIETAETANNGQVNCNTAPLAVLRALAPDDIPSAFLERVIEFREKIHELRDALIDADPAQTDPWGDGDEADGEAGEEGEEGSEEEEELDEDDPAYYVFQEPSEIFSKVEDQWDLSVFTDEADKEEFVSRLGVTSEVFTVKITIIDSMSGRRAAYRTVLWRVDHDEQPRIVPLMPLEEYFDPRRLTDFPEDLQEVSDERFNER